MRKFPLIFFLLLICLALSACRGASSAPAEASAEVLAVISASPSPDQPPTRTALALPLTSTPSAAPAVTPTRSPTATTMALQPCSPLGEHSLAELPEIVSDPYNPPPMGSDARHQGVDFSYYRRGERTSILGVGVQSVFAGQAAAAISDSFPYGNLVIVETPASDLPPGLAEQLGIREGESLYTLYAHMGAPPLVALGDAVAACQALGEVGKSGNAGVPHLHTEMRIGPQGQTFAGMAFYSTQTTQAERDNYVLWRMSGEFRHFDPLSVLVP